MSAPTVDSARDMVFQALEGHLDEPPVSAQWFRHAGGFENKGGMTRVPGRMFKRRDDHPANRLAYLNVLALTESRLIAFTARTGMSGLKVKERIGEWPVEGASVKFQKRSVTATNSGPDGSAGVDIRSAIVRATLREHGDPRELRMDFPDDPLTRELMSAFKARRREGSSGRKV